MQVLGDAIRATQGRQGAPQFPAVYMRPCPPTSQGTLRVGGADSCDNPGPGPGHRRCSAKERDSVPSPGSLHPPALSGTPPHPGECTFQPMTPTGPSSSACPQPRGGLLTTRAHPTRCAHQCSGMSPAGPAQSLAFSAPQTLPPALCVPHSAPPSLCPPMSPELLG